ncbi:uncharacterized protein MAM_08237 [Metarhizium album ARSEF 1941]|uniref:AB hydrolase-1 domain-containing protein n=1 Tax=Metarhizium album (strain ARSEF 1941) TaxID=1081103 RepID=A0A0B2WK79_METAS|nr:uncharacterized protein MAM_08237 [Metarhizium album ARSEF 1941]KHN93877.1 hypothetical protein MAM_08237 [Metarhizium album ARSEF 1941]
MDEYSTKGLDPAPPVSMTTIPMAGILVDVYGQDELASADMPLTCLWLLHPRTRTRARMRDIACRTVDAWHRSASSPASSQGARGLVALAFDMPNHGTRLVSELANRTWDEGNERHALDMAGIVKGCVGDLSALMDLVAGYLGRRVDAHVCLGWSLGGHAAWWSWFVEDRIDAAVAVVGCPDYLNLMGRRARGSGLDAGDASLLGSRYFPRDLLAACRTRDPKSILFGADGEPVPSPPLPEGERPRLREVLDARVKGKKLLACSGGEDVLVPYASSSPFLGVLKDAAEGWYRDGEVVVEDRVYAGVGHRFSADMVRDAVGFLVRVVADGPRRRASGSRLAE